MRPTTLSGRLPVIALVGHYPANKLMGRNHLPEQQVPKDPTIYSSDHAIR